MKIKKKKNKHSNSFSLDRCSLLIWIEFWDRSSIISGNFEFILLLFTSKNWLLLFTFVVDDDDGDEEENGEKGGLTGGRIEAAFWMLWMLFRNFEHLITGWYYIFIVELMIIS